MRLNMKIDATSGRRCFREGALSALRMAVVAVSIVAMLSACTSDRSDRARALLATVPADAGSVAVINTERLLRDGGGKVESDGKSVPGKELGAIVDAAGVYAQALLSDSAGVDASVAVVFTDGYYSYITGALRDAGAFEAFWKGHGRSFVDADGLRVDRNIVFTDKQFWMSPEDRRPDPKAIQGYISLSEKRSWTAHKGVDVLLKGDADVTILADVNTLARRGASKTGFSMAPLVLSMVFKDAQWISATMDLDKGKAAFDCRLLDSEFNASEFMLPLGTVDPAIIKGLDCSAGMIGAVAVPSKLISRLSKQLPSGLPAMYEAMLRPVDGTVAFAMDAAADAGKIAVQTNGSSATELRDGLEMLLPGGETRTNGKVVSISRGSILGRLPSSQFAPRFKGVAAGMVFNVGGLSRFGLTPGEEKIDRAEVMALPDGVGLRMRGEIFSSEKNRYFLFTLLELSH